ncbi:MAG TPA: hypothetical protein VII85_08765 [Candidatus Krumholzibacteriaceae bacterium]
MNRFYRLVPASVLVMIVSSAFWAGCSKKGDIVIPPPPAVLDLTAIICNPLAPAPGDTTQLTAQVRGTGDNPTYEWQAQAGTLIENGSISIKWLAPADPGIYRVFVRAAVGSDIDTMSKYIMVRNVNVVNNGLRYAFYPTIVEGELYYTGTTKSLSDNTFYGFHAYHLELPPAPIDVMAAPEISGGSEFQFFPDGIVTSSITEAADYIRQQPMNVYFFPYLVGPKKAISNNEVEGTLFRRNQNHYASPSSDLGMYVWQYNKVGPADDGSQDLLNVRFRAGAGPLRTLTVAKDSIFQFGAWSYKFYRNIKPLFTPDNGTIIYFADSTETYEPCLIPLDGTEPVIAQRRAIHAGQRHGIFFYAGIKVSEKTVFQWNPAIATQLGFIDDARNFCLFDYADSTAKIVSNVGKISEFVWDPSGKITAVNEAGVIVATPGGVPDTVFVKERSSDDVVGVNWSPGTSDQKVGFRLVRKGASPVESFSALVIYSVDNHRWYYATPQIRPAMSTEPTVDYRWWRAIFDSEGGMYAPVPISTGGGSVVLYYTI